MKELSIEAKAKRYDEAIERAKNYYSTTDSASDIKLIGLIFPELKESEGKDEKIRKALIRAFKSLNTIKVWNGIERTDIIAWLEKQGNLMKALQISNAKIGELIEKNYYLKEQLEKQGNNMGISEVTKQELEDNLNKALEKETPESCNEFLDEQKPVFEMKTPEESLGIDSDTYNKIVDKCIYGEQKPTWSEEDEIALGDALWCCKQAASIAKDENDMGNVWFAENWLKSLKDRVQPKQEWSEEDEEIYRKCICAMRASACGFPEEEKFVEQVDNWLKSLRPQNTWKPSDEQMEALDDVISSREIKYDILSNLWQDLKKLREE